MKLAVFSDIHGNIWGLKEALRLLEGYSFDRMVFLGDIFGYYYRQREVFEELRKLPDLIWLFGNHDQMFLEAMDGRMDEERLISRYGHSYADLGSKGLEDIAAFLRTLSPRAELDAEGTRVLCVHGTPWDPLNGRMYPDNPVKNPESYAAFDIVLQGHTHCRMRRFADPEGNSGTMGSTEEPGGAVRSVPDGRLTGQGEADHPVPCGKSVGQGAVDHSVPPCVVSPESDARPAENQTLIVNPGSVGQPRDGRGYSFAIVDTKERSVSFVPYAIDRRSLYEEIDRYDPDLQKLKAVLERKASDPD